MRTYHALYLESIARLKQVVNRKDLSPEGEREFEKHLNRTHRLYHKALKEQDAFYSFTPDFYEKKALAT